MIHITSFVDQLATSLQICENVTFLLNHTVYTSIYSRHVTNWIETVPTSSWGEHYRSHAVSALLLLWRVKWK